MIFYFKIWYYLPELEINADANVYCLKRNIHLLKRSGLDIDHAVCVNAADEERNRFQIYHDGIGNITTVKENDVLKLSHTY